MGIESDREPVIAELLAAFQQVRPGERAMIALDGHDGVGKTQLSHELVDAAGPAYRPMVPVSIDGFHHPRAVRRAAGQDAESYYRSSYRYQEFRRRVVEPIRAGRPITPAIWDVALDRPVPHTSVEVPPEAIVLVDGIFLQRPELADVWDATVWVDAPFAVTVPRGNARFPGDHDADPEAPSNQRYVGGQRLYLTEADPVSRSTWMLDNTDLRRPRLTRVTPPVDRTPNHS
ncbi:nucleoside/nucleotide kinase family protein [Microlunatus soli]|uniref:Uridine kinase n=1 Tax=Microlunatus soli TaxID=630515 RepID=A0A1H1V429_9ACTN|nr:uridine kinase [Microlunatus soli]SDS79488.1 uridine kinase [Microlunatus soli]